MLMLRIVLLATLVVASAVAAYVVTDRARTHAQVSVDLVIVLAVVCAVVFGGYGGIAGRRRLRANDPGTPASTFVIAAGGAIGAAVWAGSGFVVRTYMLAALFGILVAGVVLAVALFRAVGINEAVQRMRRYERAQRSPHRDSR